LAIDATEARWLIETSPRGISRGAIARQADTAAIAAADGNTTTGRDLANRMGPVARATDQEEGRQVGHRPTGHASLTTPRPADQATIDHAPTARPSATKVRPIDHATTSHGPTVPTTIAGTMSARGQIGRTNLARGQIGHTRIVHEPTALMATAHADRRLTPVVPIPRGPRTPHALSARQIQIETHCWAKGRSSLRAAGPSRRRSPRAAMRSDC
jgi:hypothetical protein